MTNQKATQAKDSHNFAPEILRAYDIRGVVGDTLTKTDAYYLGRAFGTYIRRREGSKVCLGYDGRTSSPELAGEVARGLSESGVDVEQVGLGPTPMVYFAVKDRMADGGIMVTGSHNPPMHNGFKMTLQTGPVYGEAVQELGEIAASGDFESGNGVIEDYDISKNYVSRLIRDLSTSRPLKIAWDAGNGAAGPILRKLIQHLPGEHILLYDEVDGLFPAHHPDPTVDENLKDLQNVVMNQGCHMGIAFDGDGDRIGVVDEKGNVVRGDLLLVLYAREILEDMPGSTIIADVKCSQVLFDEIERLGGETVICATGHSILKSKLNELRAPLAGELSGHIFFADKYYGFDDALYCGVRLMNLLDDTKGGLSELLKGMPTTINTPEIRFEVEESQKFGLIDRAVDFYKSLPDAKDWEVVDIDGIRLVTPYGWLLMRASNTQNVLSMRMEANSREDLGRLKALAGKGLSELGLDVDTILSEIDG